MYYLFVIKDEYYKKNDSYLYSILKKLKYSSIEDFNYSFSIYHSICNIFDDFTLKNYIDKKYGLKTINNIYYIKNKNTSFQFNKSHCWIKTDRYLRELLCIFYIYHKNIFVCDFDNNKYFWVRDYFSN